MADLFVKHPKPLTQFARSFLQKNADSDALTTVHPTPMNALIRKQQWFSIITKQGSRLGMLF